MKLIILITLLTTLTAQADERIEWACETAANMGKIGFEMKSKIKSQEDFIKRASKLTELKRQSVTLGYLATSQEEAFTRAYENCLNFKDGKI